MKRMLRLAAALAAASMPLATAAVAQDTPTVRWGVSVNASLSHAIAPMLELDEEVQAAHGINFETVDFAGNFQACMALAISGEVDVCQTGPTIGMNAIAQGGDLRAVIMMIGQIIELTIATDVAERLGIAPDDPMADRVRALEGLRIAGPGPGTTPYIVLEGMLESAGLGTDDIQFQSLTDLPAMNAGMAAGRIDAALWSVGGLSPAQADGTGISLISLATGDLPELAGLPNVASFGRTEWIMANTDTLERVQAAFVDVLERLRADPIAYAAAYKEAYLGAVPQETWEANLAATLPAYYDDMEGSQADWDFWVEALVAGAPETDFTAAYYENAFVPLPN